MKPQKMAWRTCYECHRGYPVFASAKRVENKKGNFCSAECVAARRLRVHGRDCLQCGSRYVEKSVNNRNGGFCKEECRLEWFDTENGGEYRDGIESWLNSLNRNHDPWAIKCHSAAMGLRRRNREIVGTQITTASGSSTWENTICSQMNLLKCRIANAKKDAWAKRCERAAQTLRRRAQWASQPGEN